MTQREKEANGDGTLVLLHQLAGDIVNGSNMIGIDGMAETVAPGKQRRSEEHGIVVKRQDRVEPTTYISCEQEEINTDYFALNEK